MFHFPLQSLLNHRKYLEEALQIEMADLQQRLEAERQRADVLCRALVDNRQRLDGMQRNGARACDLQMAVRYLARLAEQITLQEKTLQRAVHRIERKRADLIEAVKQRKVIEKLKEKSEQAYQEENRRKEMNLINEIAIGRFNRSKKAEG
ncbi:MAG: flagellar export protein FliJ [Pseudomonadota bacterium]